MRQELNRLDPVEVGKYHHSALIIHDPCINKASKSDHHEENDDIRYVRLVASENYQEMCRNDCYWMIR